jgi:hypothetical protein
MIRYITSRFQEIFKNKFLDLGDYSRTVFLAGTGRSGTTWIQEIINHNNTYRIMFEPFHSQKIELIKNWHYRQYIRSDDLDEKFLKPASAILSGNIRHEWIDAHNRKLVARKRLIKDIRAQLFLKWMKQNFPEIPIIFLIRHPCAVANSRLKLKWQTHLPVYLAQEHLKADFLNPFREDIENAGDQFEKHIFSWCIENYIPLGQFSRGDILLLFYENLCTRPHEEIKSIFSFIGDNFSSKSLNLIHRPSALSRKESAINTGADLIDSWRKNINADMIKRALRICTLFGMNALYGESSLPLLDGDEALKAIRHN